MVKRPWAAQIHARTFPLPARLYPPGAGKRAAQGGCLELPLSPPFDPFNHEAPQLVRDIHGACFHL